MARQWRTNNAGRLAADNRLLPGRTAVRSHRWEITRRNLAALDDRIVRLRDQHLHQIANDLAATADVIVIENLNIKNMTHTARGNLTDPGRNVRAKAALNRAILNSGWGRLHRMLADRAEVYGIELVAIPARDTSRTCAEPECGHCEKDNRHGVIALEVGGSNADRNLWPEPGYPNAKDKLENRLHQAICDGSTTLHAAQRRLVADWTRRY